MLNAAGAQTAGIVHLLAHAALWAAIARVLRHAPVLIVVLVAVAAAAILLTRRPARLPRRNRRDT